MKVAGLRVGKLVRDGCVLSPYLFNILAEMVTRVTLDGIQGGIQIGGRLLANLRYADDIILLASSEAELQQLVKRLNQVSLNYSLIINTDKTKIMASDGTPGHILIDNEQLEQVNTFPLRKIKEFRARLSRAQAIGGLGHHSRKCEKVTAYRSQLRYD